MFKPLCLVFTLIALLVSGCDWDYPLSSPEEGQLDKSLVGFWRLQTENDNAVISFTPSSKLEKDDQKFKDFDLANLKRVLISTFVDLNFPSKPGDDEDTCWAWTVVIDDVQYLNLQYIEEPTAGEEHCNVIIKYQVEGDTLHWWKLSETTKERIDKKLGEEYTPAELRREILACSGDDWEKVTLTRI